MNHYRGNGRHGNQLEANKQERILKEKCEMYSFFFLSFLIESFYYHYQFQRVN